LPLRLPEEIDFADYSDDYGRYLILAKETAARFLTRLLQPHLVRMHDLDAGIARKAGLVERENDC
jgi:hypothetical protein